MRSALATSDFATLLPGPHRFDCVSRIDAADRDPRLPMMTPALTVPELQRLDLKNHIIDRMVALAADHSPHNAS